MKSSANLIDAGSQYTDDIEGYVFDGADESQAAYWICRSDRESKDHEHDYDEYFVVVAGQYNLHMNGQILVMKKGDEAYIPKGTPHGGSCIAGTRTIHVFGGKRAKRTS